MGEEKEMKILSAAMLTLLLCVPAASLSPLLAVEEGCKANLTKDCPEGLVCFTIPEWQEIRSKIIRLEESEGLLRARKLSRVGSTVGCGGGVAVSGETEASIYCGYMWGFRW